MKKPGSEALFLTPDTPTPILLPTQCCLSVQDSYANSWHHRAPQVLILHICSRFSEQVTTFVINAVSFFTDALDQGNFIDS